MVKKETEFKIFTKNYLFQQKAIIFITCIYGSIDYSKVKKIT